MAPACGDAAAPEPAPSGSSRGSRRRPSAFARRGHVVGPAENLRPREEERHFHVENHEQQGDDVETQVELNPGAADGRLAALVDRPLLGARLVRPDDLAGDQVDEDEADAHGGEQENVDGQVHAIRPRRVRRVSPPESRLNDRSATARAASAISAGRRSRRPVRASRPTSGSPSRQHR